MAGAVTPAQFFRYCPTETVASGTASAAAFSSWVVVAVSDASTQAQLSAYLSLAWKAAVAASLNLASYLTEPSSQPLHALSLDMSSSYAAIGATQPAGLGGYFDMHAYVQLGVPDGAGARPVLSGAALLAHLQAGSQAIVQVAGDALSNVQVTVTAVSGTASVTLLNDASLLPQTETVLLTSVFVSDARRASDVICFRQFAYFAAAATAANDASFNPFLYRLLYRAIDASLAPMTAAQLYDDYAANAGRIGSVADLRSSLSATTMPALTVTSLLDAAALQFTPGGAVAREIAALADVQASDPAATSDAALVTAAAARAMVAAATSSLASSVSTADVSCASLAVAGALTAGASGVVLTAQLTAAGIQATDVRAACLDAARVQTEALFVADASTLGQVLCDSMAANTAAIGDATVDSASVSTLSVSALSVTGGIAAPECPATVGALVVAGDAAVDDGLTVRGGLVTDSAQVSGALLAASLAVTGDASVSGRFAASGPLTAPSIVAGALMAGDGSVTVSAPLRTNDVRAAAVVCESVEVDGSATFGALTAASAELTSLTVATAVMAAVSIGRVAGSLEVSDKVTSDAVKTGALSAQVGTLGDLTVGSLAASSLQVTADVTLSLLTANLLTVSRVTAGAVVAQTLEVQVVAYVRTLAVGATATVQTLHVATNAGVAGLLTAGGAFVQGGLTAATLTVTAGASVTGGDLSVPEGDLTVGGKVTASAASLSGDIDISGAATVGAGISAIGPITGGAFSGASASFAGNLYAGQTSLGDVSCLNVDARALSLLSDARVAGDVAAAGDLSVGGEISAGGGVTAIAIVSEGDVDVARDVGVGRDLSVAGNASAGGHLLVSGDASVLGNLSAGAAQFVGPVAAADLTSAGDVVAGSRVICAELNSGAADLEELSVRGDATVAGSGAFGGDLTVSGRAAVHGDASASGDVDVGGSLTAGDLTCGPVTCGDLESVGAISARALSADTISAAEATAGALRATPETVAVNGSLDVAGDVTLQAGIDFGTTPVAVRTSVTAPEFTAGAVYSVDVYAKRLVIVAADADLGTVRSGVTPQVPDPLIAQVATLSAQIAELQAALVTQQAQNAELQGEITYLQEHLPPWRPPPVVTIQL